MQVRPLESLTKEELIGLIKQEREHNEDALAEGKTSDSVLNAKYTDGYISGYVVACNFAASLASEAWVNHVFHTGLDGLIERCKNMEQVLLEKAQACRAQGRGYVLFYPLAMIPEGWKLVPVEPTREMKTAAICVEVYPDSPIDIGALTWEEVAAVYKAMLAAAPQPDRILDDEPTPTQIAHWLADHEAQLSKTELGNAAPDHYELEYYIDDELGWRFITGPDPLALILEEMK